MHTSSNDIATAPASSQKTGAFDIRNVHRLRGLNVVTTPEIQMSSYAGPNGRLTKRDRTHGLWVALTIVSTVVIGTAIFGLPTIAAAFRYIGL